MVVPGKIFFKACKKADWVSEDDPVEVEGFRVEERHIYVKTGRSVPVRSPVAWLRSKAETMFAIRLSYKDKYVFMHYVTWEYIRRNAVDHLEWERKQTRAKKKKKVAKR